LQTAYYDQYDVNLYHSHCGLNESLGCPCTRVPQTTGGHSEHQSTLHLKRTVSTHKHTHT